MKKPTRVIVDGKLELNDIKAIQITFDTNKETHEPYEMTTLHDNNGGIQTFPISRLEFYYD